MSLFQSNLRKQIRILPKILNFVKKIHYYSKLFTSLLTEDRSLLLRHVVDRHVGRSRLVDHALKHFSPTKETFLRCTMRREAQRIYQKSSFKIRADNCFLLWLAYALRDVRSHCKAPTQGLVHGRRSGRVVLRRPIRCEDQKAPCGRETEPDTHASVRRSHFARGEKAKASRP